MLRSTFARYVWHFLVLPADAKCLFLPRILQSSQAIHVRLDSLSFGSGPLAPLPAPFDLSQTDHTTLLSYLLKAQCLSSRPVPRSSFETGRTPSSALLFETRLCERRTPSLVSSTCRSRSSLPSQARFHVSSPCVASACLGESWEACRSCPNANLVWPLPFFRIMSRWRRVSDSVASTSHCSSRCVSESHHGSCARLEQINDG